MSAMLPWRHALPVMLGLALIAWAIATLRRNVGLVDIFWALFFLAGAAVYAAAMTMLATRGLLVLALVAVWAVRLSGYLAARNWNAPEDHRYRAMRVRNDPGFAWKSLYLVFGLVVFGIGFEALADAQLARFKAQPASAGRVMDRGLWRFSRHPNYFGECCVWWGLYVIAFAAGGWWTAFSPVVMTVLLLKVSGVTLLEKDIGERRPAYRDYAARTNAFFPGPRREA